MIPLWLAAFLPGIRTVLGEAWTALRSPVTLILLGLLAAAIWTAAVWNMATDRARSACEADALRSRIAVLEREVESAAASARTARAFADENEAAAAEMKRERDDYAAQLAKRPAPAACAFDGDDVRRLMRNGKPAAKPARPRAP